MSSSCAECKLFEIRGSIFYVGDPINAGAMWKNLHENICKPDFMQTVKPLLGASTSSSQEASSIIRIFMQQDNTACVKSNLVYVQN